AAYIYYHRAIAYRFSKDYDNALNDLNKAIDLYPDYYLAYNMLGNIYFDQEQYDAALKYYQKAIELNPDYVVAYYNVANIYYEQGNYSAAKNYFNKIVILDPNGPYGNEATKVLNNLKNMGY
ncbi:MAG: tetratricopeptide repeat protein, partial [Bacteroidales bacterium]